MTLNVTIIETKKIDEIVNVNLFDTDVVMLGNIRDKVGLIAAIKVFRLMVPRCGLKDAKEYIENI